ncbi:MAG: SufS family cysteine desulfurase [Planctomycetes bacterium]|nr:SufS family cysteine desulfurase [Planctomycetota bacterium]
MNNSAPLPGSGALRAEFPILERKVHGQALVYLDNAATTQKPRCVIDKLTECYTQWNANVHRGVHLLSQEATEHYEGARSVVARFIGAKTSDEIVFVRGATEGINLVAQTLGRTLLGAGDEVLITALEHHSNIVPWQLVCRERGATLVVCPITDAGELVPGAFESLLTPRTKIAAFTWVSNALGTVNPVAGMCAAAQRAGAITFVDACQAVPHFRVNVQTIGCDFLVFSGHKVYAPNGSGVLWGRKAVLDTMPPWQGGGDMISSVTFEASTWNRVPHKFEAGTPDYPAAAGLATALTWLDAVGMERVQAHETALLALATNRVGELPGVRIIGTAAQKASVLSFVIAGIHPHDIGTILDRKGVAIRAGHHCAQPVMDRLGLPATARASFGVSNNSADIDALVDSIRMVQKLFGS